MASDYLKDARSDAERIAQRERIAKRAWEGKTFEAQIVRDLLRDIGFEQGMLRGTRERNARLAAALDAREREVAALREALAWTRRDALAVYENTDEASMSHMDYYQASSAFRARLGVALDTMNRALAAPPQRPATGEGDAFQREVYGWARETFPHQTVDSILAHLGEEVAELRTSRDPEEAADCLIALCSFAGLRGFSLLTEGRRKLAINRGRTWAPPDADGISRHVRDADDAAEIPSLGITLTAADFGEPDAATGEGA